MTVLHRTAFYSNALALGTVLAAATFEIAQLIAFPEIHPHLEMACGWSSLALVNVVLFFVLKA